MALSRLKFIESLKYEPPGEWGKLLGLDRTPEPRTLRNKIAHLATNGKPVEWGAELCKKWMMDAPNEAGILYVDGHVRVWVWATKGEKKEQKRELNRTLVSL